MGRNVQGTQNWNRIFVTVYTHKKKEKWPNQMGSGSTVFYF